MAVEKHIQTRHPWDDLPDAPAMRPAQQAIGNQSALPPLPLGFVLDADITKPLHGAAAHGNLADVERYLQNGIAVDARDKYGSTPLRYAAVQFVAVHGGKLDVVEFLKQHGATE